MKKLSIAGIFMWICMGMILAQPEEIDLAKGLKAYYSFDGKRTNSMKKGAPRAVISGTKWEENRFGYEESALTFNGINDQVLIPANDVLDIGKNEGYTLSVWIKPLDDNTGCILLKESDFGIKWNGMRKPLTVFNGIAGGYPQGNFSNWSSSEWYNIVLVKRYGKVELYINGNLDKSFTITAKGNGTQKPIYIGKHPYFWGGFEGKIDDVALFGRALSKYEILTLSQIENIPLESFSTVSQPSIELKELIGTWEGVISQPGNTMVPNYVFSIRFKEIESDFIKGYSRIEVPENNAFGVIQIQAFFSGNALNFEEIQIYRQKNYLGYDWCKKYGQLTFSKEENALKGKWYSNNCSSLGEIVLYKTDASFNYYDNRLSRSVSLDELESMISKLPKSNFSNSQPVNGEEDGINNSDLMSIKVDLEPIGFKFGKALITDLSKQYLVKELVPVLQKNTQIKLKISGYTDSSGDDQLNLRLSTLRAKAVYEFLVENGISPDRLNFQGYGESNPISTNDTQEGRMKNRRVEFEVSI